MSHEESPPAAKPAALFVAVGHFGLRLISTDGLKWTHLQTGKEGEVYRAAAFGNGRFAAVGSYGGSNIFASTVDGVTWQTMMKDARYVSYVRGIGFGNGQFLGLGGDPGSVGDSRPFVMTSEDGLGWSEPIPNIVNQALLPETAQLPDGKPAAPATKPPASSKNMLRRVAWGKDRFVAVGDRGRRSVSKDGREWTDAPNVKAIDTLIDVAYGNGVFVGVGLHGLRMSSEDGVTWSERMLGEEGEHLNSVIRTGDRFVAVGQGATYTSTDGREWTRTVNKNAPTQVAYGGGIYVGSAWRGRIMISTDAVDWSLAYQADHHVESIAFGGPG